MKKMLLLGAAVALVLGVLAFVLQPGPPDTECVPDSAPSSGFVDQEKDCHISIASYEKIRQYDSSPKLFRIAGLGLVVVGIGLGIAGLIVKGTPKPGAPAQTAHPGSAPPPRDPGAPQA